MYYLMNKDKLVLEFIKIENEFDTDITYKILKQYESTPFGFQDITYWIEHRKAARYNSCLNEVMKRAGLYDNESFIKRTHAAGINDTFWIKAADENISWSEVSLYRKPFSSLISKLAFEGCEAWDINTFLISGEELRSTDAPQLHREELRRTDASQSHSDKASYINAPELTSEGSFRKCFIKEDKPGEFGSDIYYYKREGNLGPGREPYCEILAAEIAKVIAPGLASVKYDLCRLDGVIATKCNIFTNENVGYASYSKVNTSRSYSLRDVWKYYCEIGAEQEFRELLIIDSLCFNQDRHSGNFGVLFDNDSMKVIGMAPVFDLNLSMFPYVEMEEFNNIGDKLYGYSPKLGNDFTQIGQLALNESQPLGPWTTKNEPHSPEPWTTKNGPLPPGPGSTIMSTESAALNDSLRDRVKDILDYRFKFRGDESFSEKRVRKIEDIVHRQAKAILSNETLLTQDVFFSREAELAKERHLKAALAKDEMNDFYEQIDESELSPNTLLSLCEDSEIVKLYVEYDNYEFIIDFLEKSTKLQKNAKKITMQELMDEAPEFYDDVVKIKSKLINIG